MGSSSLRARGGGRLPVFFLAVDGIAPAFGQIDWTDCLHLRCCYPRFPSLVELGVRVVGLACSG